MRFSTISRSVLLLAGLGVAGCAATQPLHTEAPTAAIRSAEEVGAADNPQAALHLQYAKEEMKASATLNTNGKVEEARSLLLRAEADAELAVALARADDQKTEAKDAVERVRKLQSENPYAAGGDK